jgi:hypothetical protein
LFVREERGGNTHIVLCVFVTVRVGDEFSARHCPENRQGDKVGKSILKHISRF